MILIKSFKKMHSLAAKTVGFIVAGILILIIKKIKRLVSVIKSLIIAV
jgi:hypothetical protein